MSETIDLYNRQRHPLGRTAAQGAPLASGCYHVGTTGWISSAKGAFLLVRPKGEDGLWQAPGGDVLAGETSLAAVLRQVGQQLGLEIDPKTVKLLSSERRDREKLFYDVFLLRSDTRLEDLTVDAETLAEARWMMPVEIEQLHRDGLLSPRMAYYADVVYPD